MHGLVEDGPRVGLEPSLLLGTGVGGFGGHLSSWARATRSCMVMFTYERDIGVLERVCMSKCKRERNTHMLAALGGIT